MYGPKNEPRKLAALPEDQEQAHQRNFLDAIQTGQRLNAEIETGHLSATLCHLGNIVARTGRSVKFDTTTEQIRDDPEANALTRRSYRANHWAMLPDA